MNQILIVEDEVHLAELERDYLVNAGFDVDIQTNGNDALLWLQDNDPQLVVLDLMLPGVDGLDICRELRRTSNVPIIMTTAKAEEVDRLIGLELGADDYLCKPFSIRELVARVRTVLRRVQFVQQPASDGSKVLLVKSGTTQATRGELNAELTVVELNLLELLMGHPRRIFSRDQIIDRIYTDRRVVSDRTVDSHIKKLRKKLTALNESHDYIHSVYGAGYRFEPEVDSELV